MVLQQLSNLLQSAGRSALRYSEKKQPITFTECVGNFTGPLGEYNVILKKQLGAQLNWTGHSPEQRIDALNYQAFMVKHATNPFGGCVQMNPRLSGLNAFHHSVL